MSLWFELAQVFHTPVRHLRQMMSLREFWQWAVYRKINGPLLSWQRGDWHAASICRSMVGGKLAEHKLEFYRRKQSDSEMLEIVLSLGGIHGGDAPTMTWNDADLNEDVEETHGN